MFPVGGSQSSKHLERKPSLETENPLPTSRYLRGCRYSRTGWRLRKRRPFSHSQAVVMVLCMSPHMSGDAVEPCPSRFSLVPDRVFPNSPKRHAMQVDAYLQKTSFPFFFFLSSLPFSYSDPSSSVFQHNSSTLLHKRHALLLLRLGRLGALQLQTPNGLFVGLLVSGTLGRSLALLS